MAGEWDTPDLSALMEAVTVNFDNLERLVAGNLVMRALGYQTCVEPQQPRGRDATSRPTTISVTPSMPGGSTRA